MEVEAYLRTKDEDYYRQGWELPRQIRDSVPFYLRDLVCMCIDTPRKIDREVNYRAIFKCSECDKYSRVIQRICKKCDVRFVLTFSHPRYVTIWPTCWDCTQDEKYDPWYDMVSKFPASSVASSYNMGAYDNWPGSAIPIIPPKPEDLIHKEQVTDLVVEDINLDLDSLF